MSDRYFKCPWCGRTVHDHEPSLSSRTRGVITDLLHEDCVRESREKLDAGVVRPAFAARRLAQILEGVL